MRETFSPVYVYAFTIARDVDCCFIHIEQDEITKGSKKRLRLESNERLTYQWAIAVFCHGTSCCLRLRTCPRTKSPYVTPQSNGFMGMLIDLDLAKDSGARQRRTQSHWHDGAHGCREAAWRRLSIWMLMGNLSQLSEAVWHNRNVAGTLAKYLQTHQHPSLLVQTEVI